MAGHGGKPGVPTDADSPEWLFHYLRGVYADLEAEYFRRRFGEGCLLLLDRLDEIPGEAARDEIVDVLWDSPTKTAPATVTNDARMRQPR